MLYFLTLKFENYNLHPVLHTVAKSATDSQHSQFNSILNGAHCWKEIEGENTSI